MPRGARAGVLPFKTGTSYGYRDAWAVGWDGQHVIGVWLGRADGTPVPGVFGAEVAAPVLFEAFAALKSDLTPLTPPPPNALVLTTAELPQPLRQFRARNDVFSDVGEGAPEVVFPPTRARLALVEGRLSLKLRGGPLRCWRMECRWPGVCGPGISTFRAPGRDTQRLWLLMRMGNLLG